MTQQTLLPSRRQTTGEPTAKRHAPGRHAPKRHAPQKQALRKQTSQREPRPAPASHRRPRTPGPGSRKGRLAVSGVAGLVLAFVLSLLAGVLLAVHGPSGAPAADGPSVTLQPETPAEPTPTKPAEPTKPVEGGTAEAGPAKAEKVALRSGDTLWELARTHGTSVKVLQRLNDLGSSTLIYAGQTLDVPAAPGSAGSARQSSAAAPAAVAAGGQPSATSADKPAETETETAKPTKPTKRDRSAPSAVIAYARAQIGKPYVWGGTGPGGFDCSGLVMRAWERAGVKLPRTTWDQIHAGTATTRSRLVPGDLVLSYGGGHVGLYIGNGRIIHAPRPGTTITTAPLPAPSVVTAYRHIHL
ncbi:C40 family peptidase [Streptomyces lancefieldiae]|uniref:NlpC/P60 family protein n=1 Tax=Streptomyces lancefieldiae TaxID=3075520 RepID=A0ABU3ARZ8_9ACTN|nr:NlpC/P60 family protein [Streptomyces sp. DSM 40712]MDT0612708.1 NlpC/P60 family protein [Streptomyces sp. DSM 40712]